MNDLGLAGTSGRGIGEKDLDRGAGREFRGARTEKAAEADILSDGFLLELLSLNHLGKRVPVWN